jgi:hypothetical protein
MTTANAGLVQSIQARIVNHAKRVGMEPTLLFDRYGLERFLYRLSKSAYSERFVLKGALLMTVWVGESVRATRDADLIGYGDLGQDALEQAFREIASTSCTADDGVLFLPDSVSVSNIRRNDPYGGRRVKLAGRLGTVKLSLQIDVGIGDAVYPPPELLEFPSLLDVPRPVLRAYRPETSIAEKLHAMVELGEANSRMKDYFDIGELARTHDFDGETLSRAIRETFKRRNTGVPPDPISFVGSISRAPGAQRQWAAFLSKSRPRTAEGFESWLGRVVAFAGPALAALARGESHRGKWPAGGPWR